MGKHKKDMLNKLGCCIRLYLNMHIVMTSASGHAYINVYICNGRLRKIGYTSLEAASGYICTCILYSASIYGYVYPNFPHLVNGETKNRYAKQAWMLHQATSVHAYM